PIRSTRRELPHGHGMDNQSRRPQMITAQPHLYRVPLDGRSTSVLLGEYSLDPAWSPDARFILYSGPDIGTKFSVKAITPAAAARVEPAEGLATDGVSGERVVACATSRRDSTQGSVDD